MRLEIKEQGNYDRITNYLNRIKNLRLMHILEKYAKKGVDALESATPVRTGLTAGSWSYEIEQGDGIYRLTFNNSNVNRGVNIALILDIGHGTGTGGWVEGLDYLNPALQPIIDSLVNEVKMEVSRL